MISRTHMLAAGAGAILAVMASAGALAFAQTTPAGAGTAAPPQRGVAGTVSAVSGDTITLAGRNGTTYTVNAGSAAITKDMTVGVGDIKVGDTLMARGSVSGTSVDATNIHDGATPAGAGFGFRHGPGRGVHGTVTAVSGDTLTVTATDPRTNAATTYTVDAGNAKVLVGSTAGQKPVQGSVGSIKTGDTVMVAGALSGTTITATVVFDGPMPAWGHKPAPTTATP